MKASLKYRIIALFTDKYPLKDLCQVLGVSYSGYYKWKRRRNLPDKDETLLELISVIYGASKGSAGYRQITCQLKTKHGLRINPKKVLRIMRKLGIQSVARRRRPTLSSPMSSTVTATCLIESSTPTGPTRNG